jgi:NADPH2:quinone reductase
MRALLCEGWFGYKGLRLTEVEPPPLRAGCVRIAVQYATVGYGQTLVVAGRYQRKPPLPFVPGTEVGGVVTEVADDVTDFAVGNRVVASLDWGGYAEQAIATIETTWHVPDKLNMAAAVTVPLTYGTSWAALHWRAKIQRGDSLVVFGAAGGVGLTAVEVGRLAGAHVVAVASSDEKLAIAREHGAHEGLRHGAPDLGRRIKALTGGRGAQIIYDPVGGPLFEHALHCAAPEARILLIGFASGVIPNVAANLLLVKNIDVIGFNFGLYIGWGLTDERKTYASRLKAMMKTLFAHTLAGDFRPLSGTCVPLDRFIDAFDAVVERRSVGRALLEINGVRSG